MSTSSHCRSRQVAGSFSISEVRSTCPVTPVRRSFGKGRYGTGIRTSDQVTAHSRRWLACLRTASSTTGVVNTPMPSRMKEIERTARTNRVMEPARPATARNSPRPAATIDGRSRPENTFIVVPLPSPDPGCSRSAASLTRAGPVASAGPPPGGGVPGTTPLSAPYTSVTGGFDGWGGPRRIPRFEASRSTDPTPTSGGETT